MRWGGRRVQRLRITVLAVYGASCWLCGRAIDGAWDIDHVVPRSAGGTDALINLRPAHAGCNRGRGARQAARPPSWVL